MWSIKLQSLLDASTMSVAVKSFVIYVRNSIRADFAMMILKHTSSPVMTQILLNAYTVIRSKLFQIHANIADNISGGFAKFAN